jgi:hypothetical protein
MKPVGGSCFGSDSGSGRGSEEAHHRGQMSSDHSPATAGSSRVPQRRSRANGIRTCEYQGGQRASSPQPGSTGQTEELRSWIEKHLRDQGIDTDPADVQPDVLAALSALLPTSHGTPA